MKECINALAEEMKLKLSADIVLCIHDEVIIEADNEDAVKVAAIMNKIMNTPISDVAEVNLTATPEIKFNLSKAAESYSVAEFEAKYTQASA